MGIQQFKAGFKVLLGVLLIAPAMCVAEIPDLPYRVPSPDTGEAIFTKWCMPCHGRGTIYPGTAALAAKYNGAVPGALQDRRDLTPEFVRHFVRNGISVMPHFRETEIDEGSLNKLIGYLVKK